MPARATLVLPTLVVAVTLAASACGGGSDEASRPTTGPGLYAAFCLTCHGADGQGGVGPRLAGIMESKYPDIEDQIAVVTDGTGRMPAFGGNLSTAEIRTIVEYERTGLGS